MFRFKPSIKHLCSLKFITLTFADFPLSVINVLVKIILTYQTELGTLTVHEYHIFLYFLDLLILFPDYGYTERPFQEPQILMSLE